MEQIYLNICEYFWACAYLGPKFWADIHSTWYNTLFLLLCNVCVLSISLEKLPNISMFLWCSMIQCLCCSLMCAYWYLNVSTILLLNISMFLQCVAYWVNSSLSFGLFKSNPILPRRSLRATMTTNIMLMKMMISWIWNPNFDSCEHSSNWLQGLRHLLQATLCLGGKYRTTTL